MKLISISQLKKFMKSPSQWAGEYILGIKDKIENENFILGKIAHLIIERNNCNNPERLKEIQIEFHKLVAEIKEESNLEIITILENNCKDIKLDGIFEKKVDFDIWGRPAIGFVDFMNSEEIIDFKTVNKFSKPEDKPAMRQVVNSFEEYKLQLYFYMYATGIKKGKIIEILKSDPAITEKTTLSKDEIISYCKNFEQGDKKLTKKDIVNKYHPEKEKLNVIEFEMSDELGAEIFNKYSDYSKQMLTYYNQFKIFIDKSK